MALLDPQRLARIRSRWEENMDASAVVLPLRLVADGVETEETYPAPTDSGLTTMAGRLRPGAAPEEGTTADQDRGKTWWEWQYPVAQRLTPTDRLYVTGTDATGTTYTRYLEVVGTQAPATWQAVGLARCFEIVPDEPTTEG